MWEKVGPARLAELDGNGTPHHRGGITGAGILRRAVQEGYRTLWSESAIFPRHLQQVIKLIHGGFRYLRKSNFVSHVSQWGREWCSKKRGTW